jgi:hypothetical protein
MPHTKYKVISGNSAVDGWKPILLTSATILVVFLTLATLTAAQTKAKAIPKSRTISHFMQQIGLMYVETDNDLNDAEYKVGEDRDEARIESLKRSLDYLERGTRIEVKDGSVDSMFLDDLVHLRNKREIWAATSASHVDVPQSLKNAVHACKAEADDAIDTGQMDTDLHYQCIEFKPEK